LLSFIYATPVELGFDPNIKECTPTQLGPQYFVYTVNDKKAGTVYFKTLQSLSEYRSLCISGRATRVWQVIQIKSLDDHSPVNSAKEVVLKDIWLQQDAKTERELQTDLFTDIGAFITGTSAGEPFPPQESSETTFQELIRGILVGEQWKQHFLTIMFDSIGVPSKECPMFARPDPTLFNKPLIQRVAPGSQASDYSRVYSTSALHEKTSSTSATPAAPRKFAPKRRYFVIFEELCEAVEDLTRFSDTIDCTLLSS
jgi:Fungal protein kinase